MTVGTKKFIELDVVILKLVLLKSQNTVRFVVKMSKKQRPLDDPIRQSIMGSINRRLGGSGVDGYLQMKFNNHHIIYKEKERDPSNFDDRECIFCGHILEDDWTVDIPAFLHRHMHIIQGWNKKPDHQRYALLTSFMHAVSYEWNKMRCQLDRQDE